MRLTSDFFVSALVRRIFGEGGFAAVSRRGAAEAGAIFLVVDRLDGSYDFYAPAPQALMSETPGDRLFECVLAGVDREAIDVKLQREQRVDPDLWIVDIEARDGAIELPVAREDPPDDGFFRF